MWLHFVPNTLSRPYECRYPAWSFPIEIWCAFKVFLKFFEKCICVTLFKCCFPSPKENKHLLWEDAFPVLFAFSSQGDGHQCSGRQTSRRASYLQELRPSIHQQRGPIHHHCHIPASHHPTRYLRYCSCWVIIFRARGFPSGWDDVDSKTQVPPGCSPETHAG